MLRRLLNSLFRRTTAQTQVVEAYWCETPVRLSGKVQTPLGSRVTALTVCVDIHYSISADTILLHRVVLSRGGGRIAGSDSPINVSAQRTGEAWFVSKIHPEAAIKEAVERDLSMRDSRLRRMILGKWRALRRPSLVRSLVDALNQHAPAEEVESLIAAGPGSNDIVFTYTKATGASETRHVCVHGVQGASIQATDRRDGKVKCFRIDRITNARKAN